MRRVLKNVLIIIFMPDFKGHRNRLRLARVQPAIGAEVASAITFTSSTCQEGAALDMPEVIHTMYI
jgi:hypothetical protein